MRGKTTRALLSLCALLMPCIVVAVVFRAHLAGDATFPWDFHGAYYTHAVARMRDGGFFTPPQWLPWGGFGIPGHLSLQDGVWYLPLYLLDFLGWPYDIVNATRLQIIHVAVGAGGMYYLTRAFGVGVLGAAVISVGYTMSPAFYSNGQHVDIVRGVAMMPWLFFSLMLLSRQVTAGRFAFFVLVLWQFLVGAYPGLIVSAAYACAAIALFELARLEIRHRPRTAALIGAAVLVAAGMSAVKFVPALLDAENLRSNAGEFVGVDIPLLSTLVLDFDVASMQNDVSMRDLFMPLPLLLLAFIGAFSRERRGLPLVLLLIGILPMIDAQVVRRMLSLLPLMEVSRFHISDFRPIFHIALYFFAGLGIDELLRRGPQRRTIIGLAVGLVVIAGVMWLGLYIGQPSDAFFWPLLCIALSAPVLLLKRWPYIALPVLYAVVVLSGYTHMLRGAHIWLQPRTDLAEVSLYGATIRELVSKPARPPVEYRPPRDVLSPLPASIVSLYDPRYNFAWLAQGYSAFGYENLHDSDVFVGLYAAAQQGPKHQAFPAMSWMIRRSSVAVLDRPVRSLHPRHFSQCEGVCAVAGATTPASALRMVAFRNNGAVYEVESPNAFFIVENEPYYKGWNAVVCGAAGCDRPIAAQPVSGLLRAWSLPQGKYRLVTYFEAPYWRLAVLISAISAVLGLMVSCVLLWAGLGRDRRTAAHVDDPSGRGAP